MSIPTQIAETVQTAHIEPAPSPTRHVNPPTAVGDTPPSAARFAAPGSGPDSDPGGVSAYYRRRGRPHRAFPPLPDLRFEQSYLHSIRDADGRWGRIAWVTVKDQVMMPLLQGILYNLLLLGWQGWNMKARYSGNSLGARIRRWWYAVNDWPLPA